MAPPPPKPIGLPPEGRLGDEQRYGIGVGAARRVEGHAQVRRPGGPAQHDAALPRLGRFLDADRPRNGVAGGNRAERALEAVEQIVGVEIADRDDEGICGMIEAAVVRGRGRPGRSCADRIRSR